MRPPSTVGVAPGHRLTGTTPCAWSAGATGPLCLPPSLSGTRSCFRYCLGRARRCEHSALLRPLLAGDNAEAVRRPGQAGALNLPKPQVMTFKARDEPAFPSQVAVSGVGGWSGEACDGAGQKPS